MSSPAIEDSSGPVGALSNRLEDKEIVVMTVLGFVGCLNGCAACMQRRL